MVLISRLKLKRSFKNKDHLSAIFETLAVNEVLNKKEYKTAVKKYKDIRKEYTISPEIEKQTLFAEANIYYSQLNDEKAAQKLYGEFLSKYPKDPMVIDWKVMFNTFTADDLDNIVNNDGLDVLEKNSLEEEETIVPIEFKLLGNYPNPFNPSTLIKYNVPVTSNVRLTIYNMMGQEVRSFQTDGASAGRQSFTWNGTNQNNEQVASGIYIYRLHAVGNDGRVFDKSAKMMLLK